MSCSCGPLPHELCCGECQKKYYELIPDDEELDEAEYEKRFNKWVESLCGDCRETLEEEGFV